MVSIAHIRASSAIVLVLSALAMVAVGAVRAGAHEAVVGRGVPPAKLALDLEVASSDERGHVRLRFTLPRAGIVRIILSTLDGKEVGTLASGLSSAGENVLEIDVRDIPPGNYRCTLQTRDGNASTSLVVR